jgi:hypothetical protein
MEEYERERLMAHYDTLYVIRERTESGETVALEIAQDVKTAEFLLKRHKEMHPSSDFYISEVLILL